MKNYCKLLQHIITIRVICSKTYSGQEKFYKYNLLRCKQIITKTFMNILMKTLATLSTLKIISVEDILAIMIHCCKEKHHSLLR